MSRDAVVVGTRPIQQEFNIKAGKRESARLADCFFFFPIRGSHWAPRPQSCSWRVNFGGWAKRRGIDGPLLHGISLTTLQNQKLLTQMMLLLLLLAFIINKYKQILLKPTLCSLLYGSWLSRSRRILWKSHGGSEDCSDVPDSMIWSMYVHCTLAESIIVSCHINCGIFKFCY